MHAVLITVRTIAGADVFRSHYECGTVRQITQAEATQLCLQRIPGYRVDHLENANFETIQRRVGLTLESTTQEKTLWTNTQHHTPTS
jgi:hypothetical protein